MLQLSYDPATAIALFGSETNAVLGWFDPNTDSWMNAVAGDSDGGAANQEIFGAYNSAQDFVLGDYGVDTADHVVWAVVDHNSQFAVSSTLSVPEPSTWAILVISAGLLLSCHRAQKDLSRF